MPGLAMRAASDSTGAESALTTVITACSPLDKKVPLSERKRNRVSGRRRIFDRERRFEHRARLLRRRQGRAGEHGSRHFPVSCRDDLKESSKQDLIALRIGERIKRVRFFVALVATIRRRCAPAQAGLFHRCD